MWLLCLLAGWFISSIALHIGERRGVRMTNPACELPGFRSWYRVFMAPFFAFMRMVGVVNKFLGELIWRIIKG